ncbi:MAG: bifunctional phosphopantothenoylcysteine decarboxylase/phosphopantothenate--cysteine ligase CoaBC [Succinivibrio sp.]|nr:bifunctional phosphopantothenoylcysteine decarboxylase/phosphopantothenate--cysteine ligase CoaBC [Succinivibrio sp.]
MTAKLKDRSIVLAVTGGIAAYKACTLCRLLVKEGAQVKVLMTENATKLVTAQTFAALSGNPVGVDLFAEPEKIAHIAAAASADLVVVAPATANTIAKICSGMADNIVTSSILASTAPIVLAPAMNSHMYENLATQENLATLRRRGYFIMSPGEGELACRTSGAGRMPEPEDILDFICRLLNSGHFARIGYETNTMLEAPEKPLELGQTRLLPKADGAGLRFVITAGPTAEAIDPVRIITNRSSGKMGYALARVARAHGAEVILISGPVSLPTPAGVKRIDVTTATQMLQAVENEISKADVFIGCAAVSDYRPERMSPNKITKEEEGDNLVIRLVKNPDIIATVGRLDHNRPFTVGFAAETNDGKEHAKAKLLRKNLDLIVLNDVSKPDIGLESDENEVSVFDKEGEIAHLPRNSKLVIAENLISLILHEVRNYLASRE